METEVFGGCNARARRRRVCERSQDKKGADSGSADTIIVLNIHTLKRALRVFAALEKGPALENQEAFLPPGVLHPHGCCINASPKKGPLPSGNLSFRRLQRAHARVRDGAYLPHAAGPKRVYG